MYFRNFIYNHESCTTQKMKFIEKILNGKLNFLCSVIILCVTDVILLALT